MACRCVRCVVISLANFDFPMARYEMAFERQIMKFRYARLKHGVPTHARRHFSVERKFTTYRECLMLAKLCISSKIRGIYELEIY